MRSVWLSFFPESKRNSKRWYSAAFRECLKCLPPTENLFFWIIYAVKQTNSVTTSTFLGGCSMALSLPEYKKQLDSALGQMVWFLSGPVWSQELDSVVLSDPFQLGMFHNSVILWWQKQAGTQEEEDMGHRTQLPATPGIFLRHVPWKRVS